MNRPINRRGALAAIGALPSAVKSAVAKPLGLMPVAPVTEAMTMEAAGKRAAKVARKPWEYHGSGLLYDDEMYALFQADMLPDWAFQDIFDDEDDNYISLDVMALRSVSPTAKAFIHGRQHRRKVMADLPSEIIRRKARSAWYKKKDAKE